MRVLISGGTGFIGTALTGRLLALGHEVWILSRGQHADGDGVRYFSDLCQISDDAEIDAVINLAGASLGERRWSAKYKQELLRSRLDTTRALLDLCQRLTRKPSTWLNASAIGYYGPHGDERLGEDGDVVDSFASDLCQQWEQLALQASELGIRVCLLRLGVVIERGGSAFENLLLPFRLGVANWMGQGDQYFSWIHRQDTVDAVLFLLERTDLSGPFNLTAPEPVTSRELCAALKKRMRTLITLPMPGPVMRILAGEVADEVLLNGQRVVPTALTQVGFSFRFADIDSALLDILG